MKLVDIESYRDGGSIGLWFDDGSCYHIPYGLNTDIPSYGLLIKGSINSKDRRVLASGEELLSVFDAVIDYEMDKYDDKEHAVFILCYVRRATRALRNQIFY